jgi:hypothetical protein
LVYALISDMVKPIPTLCLRYRVRLGFVARLTRLIKLGPFVLSYPKAPQLFMAFDVHAKREEVRFVDDLLVLVHFDQDTVQIDNRVNRIQRPCLSGNKVNNFK